MRLKLFDASVEGLGYGSSLAAAIWDGGWEGPPLDHGQEIWEGLVLKARSRVGPQRIKLKTKAWMEALKGSRPNWESLA